MDNKAFFKIGYGLYLLSSSDGQRDNACVINTLLQVTSNPCLVTIAVNKQNLTHDMIVKNGKFNVSLLTESAPFEIFKQFGYQSGRTTDKLAGRTLKRSPNGLVYFEDHVNAWLSGKVISSTDLPTHTLFLAEVTDAEVLSDEESVTYSYYQRKIKPMPAETSVKKGYRCKICGYIYEGETLPDDYVCPICKHGAADFEKL